MIKKIYHLLPKNIQKKIKEQRYEQISKNRLKSFEHLNQKSLLSVALKEAHFLDKDMKGLYKKPLFTPHKKVLIKILNKIKDNKLKEDPSYLWAKKTSEIYTQWLEHKKPLTERKEKNIYDKSKITEIIKNRRSIRIWKNKQIPTKNIIELIESAKWAPSSCNRQTIEYHIYTKKEDRDFLGKLTPGGYHFLSNAPTIIAVIVNTSIYGETEERQPFLDAGAAIQNLLLKAEEINLAACWLGWHKGLDKKFQERYKIQKHMKVASIVGIGYQNENPRTPARKSTNNITKFY